MNAATGLFGGVGCQRPGSHRAPKGREHGNQYWHFCLEHVSAYNSRWDYFAGMSDSEWSEFQAREEIGHRPTWTLRGGRGDRLAAAARGFQEGKRFDPFGMFTSGEANPARAKQRRRLTRLQAKALEVLSLQEEAAAGEIRARYAELVKRWHPDSNGGDRGAETKLPVPSSGLFTDWSPDGTQIAFAGLDDLNPEIYLVADDGTGLRRLTDDGSADVLPRWSPNGTMIAFRAGSDAEVRAFHAAALEYGGTDEGAPGTRTYYQPSFYVAYVRDPDGNKLACVFHRYGAET